MAEKEYVAPPKDKRGGYSGSKPGEQMRPPVKLPSGSSKNGSSSDKK